MKFYLSIVLLGALFSGFVARADVFDEMEQKENSYWVQTGVGLNDLKKYLNNQNCYQEFNLFMSCLQGAQMVVLKYSFPHELVLPANLATIQMSIRNQVKSFGPYVVAEKTESQGSFSMSPSKRLKIEKERQKNFTELSRKEFQKRSVNFDEIFYYLSSLSIEKNKPASVLFKDFFNSYLKYSDFIQSISPIKYYQYLATQLQDEPMLEFGIVMATTPAGFIIKKLEPNAIQAGLRQGDLITHVEDLDLKTATLTEIGTLMFKKIKEPIKFRFIRHGKKYQVTLQAVEMQKKNLEANLITEGNERYLHVRLNTFNQEGICDNFLTLTEKYDYTKLIIDLRENSGGLLTEANCLTSLFLGSQKLLYMVKKLSDQSVDKVYSIPQVDPYVIKKPLVILQSGHSASASELFAGALRSHNRATIVGQRSYGKGSVNSGYVWENNPQFVHFRTTALFFTPENLTVNKAGIVPDFTVGWRSNSTPDEDFSERNEDNDHNFTNSLNGPIQPKDLEKNKKISACVNTNYILTKEKMNFGSAEGSDYPLYYALEVARCL